MSGLFSRKTLFDEVDKIPLYHNHRRNLRPWDRKLPHMVEAEADRRQHWQLQPPSALEIWGILCLCIITFQIVAMLPYIMNMQFVADTWKSISKPSVIHKDTKTLLAIWIVAHMSTGLSMWLVWLTEGFEKHQLELLTFAIATFAECAWLDVVMYTKHLDWAIGCWIVVFVFTVISQVLMCMNKVAIGAAFLIPHNAITIIAVVYLAAFVDMHGAKFEWLGQKND